MSVVETLRRRAGLTQRALARRAGTSQPTIAAYESGRKSPTLRTLERLARSCGLTAYVVFVPPLTREDRRSLHLHAVVAEKFVIEPDATIAHARHNLATMRSVNPHASPLLDEWKHILDAGVERICAVLVDPGEHARELRQVTPFAGVLTAAERAQVYRSFQRDEDPAA